MSTSSRPPAPWLARLLRLPQHLYRHGLGWMLGHRFVQLTHSGRRTGRTFSTVLEVVRLEQRTREVTVVSGFGSGADWLRNIHSNGQAQISIGREVYDATFRIVGAEEAIELFEAYERRNRFATPVIHWALSRMLGWRYDGSPSARRTLVEQLPMIAFRPR
ncbi:MAG: nitroreductase family deazaflavin-dependent oxidoreductase [Cellulomonas sp.]